MMLTHRQNLMKINSMVLSIMSLLTSAKINCTSCLQDLVMKQKLLFIVSIQAKISTDDPGTGRKASDPYVR